MKKGLSQKFILRQPLKLVKTELLQESFVSAFAVLLQCFCSAFFGSWPMVWGIVQNQPWP